MDGAAVKGVENLNIVIICSHCILRWHVCVYMYVCVNLRPTTTWSSIIKKTELSKEGRKELMNEGMSE